MDLTIQMDDGTNGKKFFVGGQLADYTITVQNIGSVDAHNASVQELLPTNLLDVSWTCNAEWRSDLHGKWKRSDYRHGEYSARHQRDVSPDGDGAGDSRIPRDEHRDRRSRERRGGCQYEQQQFERYRCSGHLRR